MATGGWWMPNLEKSFDRVNHAYWSEYFYGEYMNKNDFSSCASGHDSTKKRELDLTIGWYEFPFKAGNPSPVFDYVIGQVWNKETNPPEPDARVIFSSEAAFGIEYRCFSPNFSSGHLVCMTRHVRITQAFGLNKIDLRSVSKWQTGASKVIQKSYRQFLNTLSPTKNGTVGKRAIVAKVENILNVAPDRTLLDANKDWIFMGLPNTIHRIYQESCDFFSLLFDRYKKMGGVDDHRGFRVSMGLLLHLFKPAASVSKLSRPDGTSWRTEREILNCWEGMAQTRGDAWRYLKVMHYYCCLTGSNIVPLKFNGF